MGCGHGKMERVQSAEDAVLFRGFFVFTVCCCPPPSNFWGLTFSRTTAHHCPACDVPAPNPLLGVPLRARRDHRPLSVPTLPSSYQSVMCGRGAHQTLPTTLTPQHSKVHLSHFQRPNCAAATAGTAFMRQPSCGNLPASRLARCALPAACDMARS